MSDTIIAEAETVDEETVKPVSKKREFAAAAAAGTLTLVLGLVASGAINKLGDIVKHKIAPKPEKTEDE